MLAWTRGVWFALFGTLIVGCGNPAPDDEFSAKVVPILEQYCLGGACHGVLPDAEASGEVIDWRFFHVNVGTDLVVRDVNAAYTTVKQRINTLEPAQLSSLLRKPLAISAGGVPHLGGVQFDSLDSPAAKVLLEWIKSESDGGEGQALQELTAEQQQFADEVLPHLASRQCMNSACHGPFAPFTGFQPPFMVNGEPVFSTAAVVKNYKAAKLHLHLGGDPWLSRLVRKGLPLDKGGIPHRGGNDIFFVGTNGDPRADPAAQAIVAWAEAERTKWFMATEPELTGIVLVRGPVAPGNPFDHTTFQPGTDLFVLEPPTPDGTLRNLTAAAHPGFPADVRDPTVNHDGTLIAFAMRRTAANALNIFEIAVDGTNLRQLTFDDLAAPGGGQVANAQPTYGPDGRIYFVSTRAGMLADGYDQLDTDVWAVDPASLVTERITYDPSPEAGPSFIGSGKSYGTLAFTMRRTIGDRFEAPVFRTPLDHNKAYHGDPELHIHHGVTIDEDIVYAMRTTADGRFTCVLLDRDNVWRAGRVAVFDRQIGPELPIGDEDQATVGGFIHAFSVTDASTSSGGVSAGGAYRHPVPLPDGRILVSYAPGPVDLNSTTIAPQFSLHFATANEAEGTLALTALVSAPGISVFDAEPIVRRPLEDDPTHEHAWDPTRTQTTGTLAFRHVETLETLFENLQVRGARPLRDDLVYARLLEWVPIGIDANANAPAGIGSHGRTRILDEVPLAGGSLSLTVPADRPFRIQFLNADRMAVGTQQNRWIHVSPGEKFPGGVKPSLYPNLCASCHGSLSGDRADVGGPIPDAITAASITMATHENLNPRRPVPPIEVGTSPIEIDFVRDISPMLERSCATASCHDSSAAGGLNLTSTPTAMFDTRYEALLASGAGSGGGRVYVDELNSSAYTSVLLERITGRELGAPRPVSGTCAGQPALSSDEILQLIRWIDSGALYRGVTP